MELTERVKRAREYDRKTYAELMERPINLDELFDAVVKTVRCNYVGYEQKKQYYNPAEYHTYIYSHFRYGSLTYQMLVRSLHQFLGDLHDRRLRLRCDDWIDYRNLAPQYRVRASREVLYVTEAMPETGLVKGDRIRKVQGMTPDKIRALTRHTCFYSTNPERELWGGYLRMAQSLEVEHRDGTHEIIRIRPLPLVEACKAQPGEPAVEFRSFLLPGKPGGRGVSLTFHRMETDAVRSLVESHQEEVETADVLVLDLRCCAGGDEGAGWELFPYLIDREMPLRELIADEGSYVLCTKNNCDARIKQLEAYRESLGTDGEGPQEERNLLEEELAFYRRHSGEGLIFREPDTAEEERIRPAKRSPGRVVLLTDTFCENEAEQFAAMCQRCGKKVRTIGRPTMGTLDYEDPLELQIHEHMVLSVPIRMTKAAFEGRGISEKGLPVDEYLPWTREELSRDVLLEHALQNL